jgi:hypothetical protein
MPDETSSQPPSGDTNGHPLTQSSPFESAIEQRIVALEANSRARPQKEPSSQVLEEMRAGEWWLIGINGALLIATIVISCIYYHQLEEMRKATTATQQAAYASCVGAQVSRSALMEATQAGIDAHSSALASTYQTLVATEAEEANIVPSINDITFTTGKSMSISFSVKNVGKSVAKNLFIKARTIFISTHEDPKFIYPKSLTTTIETPQLVAGEEPSSLQNASVTPARMSNGQEQFPAQEDFDAWRNGTKDLVFMIHLTYLDSLGVSHWLNYCRYTPNKPGQIGQSGLHPKCVRYNKNDNSTILAKPKEATLLVSSIPEINCPLPPK